MPVTQLTDQVPIASSHGNHHHQGHMPLHMPRVTKSASRHTRPTSSAVTQLTDQVPIASSHEGNHRHHQGGDTKPQMTNPVLRPVRSVMTTEPFHRPIRPVNSCRQTKARPVENRMDMDVRAFRSELVSAGQREFAACGCSK